MGTEKRGTAYISFLNFLLSFSISRNNKYYNKQISYLTFLHHLHPQYLCLCFPLDLTLMYLQNLQISEYMKTDTLKKVHSVTWNVCSLIRSSPQFFEQQRSYVFSQSESFQQTAQKIRIQPIRSLDQSHAFLQSSNQSEALRLTFSTCIFICSILSLDPHAGNKPLHHLRHYTVVLPDGWWTILAAWRVGESYDPCMGRSGVLTEPLHHPEHKDYLLQC